MDAIQNGIFPDVLPGRDGDGGDKGDGEEREESKVST